MNTNTSAPPIRRISSPDPRYWVDILELGSSSKLQFITSFPISGVTSFTMVNGECAFRPDNVFMLWNASAVLIYYIDHKESLHLTIDELSKDLGHELGSKFKSVSVKNVESESPQLEFTMDDGKTDLRDLKKSLQLFKSGRASV